MLNLDHFISDCRSALAQSTPELAIKEMLARAVADPSDVEAAVGTPREAKITTLYHDRDLTILNIVWTPGMAAYPHDHRMWALIGLYGGQEDNTFYRRSLGGLQVAGGKQLETGTTALFGESLIHSVVNPLRVFTGAIHIYGGDFFGTPRSDWDPETLQERPYDVQRARKLISDANERWFAECTLVSGLRSSVLPQDKSRKKWRERPSASPRRGGGSEPIISQRPDAPSAARRC